MMNLHDDEGMAGALITTVYGMARDGSLRTGEFTGGLGVNAVEIKTDGRFSDAPFGEIPLGQRPEITIERL